MVACSWRSWCEAVRNNSCLRSRQYDEHDPKQECCYFDRARDVNAKILRPKYIVNKLLPTRWVCLYLVPCIKMSEVTITKDAFTFPRTPAGLKHYAQEV